MKKKSLRIFIDLLICFMFCLIKTDASEIQDNEQVYAFFAADEAEAKLIAEDYGTELLDFQHGVGTLSLNDEIKTRNTRKKQTELYPEYVYTVEYEEAEEKVQWHLDAVHIDELWKVSKGSGVKIAVIDTGIDRDHKDLMENIYMADTVVPEEYYGENARFELECLGPEDYLGHGTHVAGIIAAKDDGQGCIGIAPESSILSIKALEMSGNRGIGKTSWIVSGIQYAIEQGADIINLSIGGSNIKDKMLGEAVEQASEQGILVVCAAGNIAGIQQVFYPGAYDNAIAVSALRKIDNELVFASAYSNYGDWIDISAPGNSIMSTIPDGYGTKSGTSMACPIVSGIIADLIAYDSELSAAEIYRLITESSMDLGDEGKDDYYGYGAIDAGNLLLTYAEQSVLSTPKAEFEDGAKICEGYPIHILGETLKSKVVYTLDGSEPDERSSIYPKEGLSFSVGTIEIRAKCVESDGKLSDTISRSYNIVPSISLIKERKGNSETECIPLGSAVDPVLNYPARRYQVVIQPDESFRVKITSNDFKPKVYLFDRADAAAISVNFEKNGNWYQYINKTSEEKTVWLSIVDMDHFDVSKSRNFYMEWSIEKYVNDTEKSDEITDEPVLIEVVEADTPSKNEPIEESVIAETPQEEDWLYTMENIESEIETETIDENINQKKDIEDQTIDQEEITNNEEYIINGIFPVFIVGLIVFFAVLATGIYLRKK